MTERIVAAGRLAPRSAADWYATFAERVAAVGAAYGLYTFEQLVAAAAALSPSMDPERNLVALQIVCANVAADVPIGHPSAWRGAGTYVAWSTTVHRAVAILQGGPTWADASRPLPMDAKTYHFGRCILDPADVDPVTVDGHMANIAVHAERRPLGSAPKVGALLYDTVALATAQAAAELGVATPSAAQALAWVGYVDLPMGARL